METFLFDDATRAIKAALKPSAPPCATCGRSDDDLHPVKVRAALSILALDPDRARAAIAGPAATAQPVWVAALSDSELLEIGAIIRRAQARLGLPEGEVIDVVGVGDEDEE